MIYKEITKKIIALKNADLEFREKLIAAGKLGDGYNDEMAKIHIQNAKTLDEIIQTIGYPQLARASRSCPLPTLGHFCNVCP